MQPEKLKLTTRQIAVLEWCLQYPDTFVACYTNDITGVLYSINWTKWHCEGFMGLPGTPKCTIPIFKALVKRGLLEVYSVRLPIPGLIGAWYYQISEYGKVVVIERMNRAIMLTR